MYKIIIIIITVLYRTSGRFGGVPLVTDQGDKSVVLRVMRSAVSIKSWSDLSTWDLFFFSVLRYYKITVERSGCMCIYARCLEFAMWLC